MATKRTSEVLVLERDPVGLGDALVGPAAGKAPTAARLCSRASDGVPSDSARAARGHVLVEAVRVDPEPVAGDERDGLAVDADVVGGLASQATGLEHPEQVGHGDPQVVGGRSVLQIGPEGWP